MRAFIGLTLLLFTTFSANAQLLWKIDGNGLTKPSYIIGTHHLVSSSYADSISGLKKATEETAQVCGEVVMAETMFPAFMQEVQKQIMLPGDTTLKQLFTPEQYETVSKAVKENLMVDISMLDKLKPSLLLQQLTLATYMKHIGGFNPEALLDVYFQQQAKQNGKEVKGLESPALQITLLINSQSLQRQADLLYCLASNIDKSLEQAQTLTKLYKEQDLEGLLKQMEERENDSCDPLPGEMEALLDNRNKEWIKIIPNMIKDTPTLIAVGAGHLPGKNGIIQLLKDQGYSVEPIR